MRRKIDIIFTFNALLLGIVHISLTPTMFDHFSDDAHIFVGLGLAFIFLASINILRLFKSNKLSSSISLVCNLITLIYLTLPVLYIGSIEPPGYVAIVVVLVLLIFSGIELLKQKKDTL
jgi:hypothetical protein